MEQRDTAEELTDQQRITLQSVYEIFKRDGVWPSFQYIDTELDREHEIEFAKVARVIRGYLIQFDPHRSLGSTVSLTVRGISKCEGSEADLELFMRMLLWLIRRQRDWRPASTTEVEQLILTSQEARAAWAAEGYELSDVELIKAHALATQEGLTQYSSIVPETGEWQVEPDRELRRRFRGVVTIADYIALQQRQQRQASQPAMNSWTRDQQQLAEPAVQISPLPAPEQGPYVFILMPFTEPWSKLVHQTISRSCGEVDSAAGGLRWERADDISEPGRITEQIIAAIQRADAIVADVTDNNPNVMFELGFAHALSKPIVLLNQNLKSAPFDIRDWRQIPYSLDDLGKAEAALITFLTTALEPRA